MRKIPLQPIDDLDDSSNANLRQINPARHGEHGDSEEENAANAENRSKVPDDKSKRKGRKRNKKLKKKRKSREISGSLAKTDAEKAVAKAMKAHRETITETSSRRQRIALEKQKLEMEAAEAEASQPSADQIEGRGGKRRTRKQVAKGSEKKQSKPPDSLSRTLRSGKQLPEARQLPMKKRLVKPTVAALQKVGHERRNNVNGHDSDSSYSLSDDSDSDTSCEGVDYAGERNLPRRQHENKNYEEEIVEEITDPQQRELIAMQQGRMKHIIPYAPFVRLVKEICEPMGEEFRWNKKAIYALLCATEHELHDIFEKMQMAAIHANRITTNPKDFKFIVKVTGRELRSSFTTHLHEDGVALFNQCKILEPLL